MTGIDAQPSSNRRWLEQAGLVGALVLLVAVFGLASDSFFSPRTFASIANQVPDLTVIAVGMTLVLVAGESIFPSGRCWRSAPRRSVC